MKLYGTLLLCSAFLLASCGGATEVQDIEITFDGERCRYEGPEATVEGKVVMTLDNPTDHQYVHLHVFTFREGYTWQDHVEYLDGQTIERNSPPFTKSISPTFLDGDSSNNLFRERYYREWEYSLEPGSYGIICAAHRDVRGIWQAAPLEVGPVSSE